MNPKFLTDRDVETIKELVEKSRSVTMNPRQRPYQVVDDPKAPDVFIGVAPAGGIPGFSENLGTGTGSSIADVSWRTCYVYSLNYQESAGTGTVPEDLEPLRFTQNVFNLSANTIEEGSIFITLRDKLGKWLAIPLGEADPLILPQAQSYDTGEGGTVDISGVWTVDFSTSMPYADTTGLYVMYGLLPIKLYIAGDTNVGTGTGNHDGWEVILKPTVVTGSVAVYDAGVPAPDGTIVIQGRYQTSAQEIWTVAYVNMNLFVNSLPSQVRFDLVGGFGNIPNSISIQYQNGFRYPYTVKSSKVSVGNVLIENLSIGITPVVGGTSGTLLFNNSGLIDSASGTRVSGNSTEFDIGTDRWIGFSTGSY